ncbi:hypothetical protein HYW35_04085 [Candidatus Saccharibacteria bacterium]|nr:hypothetical protein [Candidatus Saccharibacteria bacterium]
MVRNIDTGAEVVVYRAQHVLLNDKGCLRSGAYESVRYANSLVQRNLGLVSLIASDSPWRGDYPGFAEHPEILRLFGWLEVEVGTEDRITLLDTYERTAKAFDKENDQLLVIETSPVGIEAARKLGCLVFDSIDFYEINAYIRDHVKQS